MKRVAVTVILNCEDGLDADEAANAIEVGLNLLDETSDDSIERIVGWNIDEAVDYDYS